MLAYLLMGSLVAAQPASVSLTGGASDQPQCPEKAPAALLLPQHAPSQAEAVGLATKYRDRNAPEVEKARKPLLDRVLIEENAASAGNLGALLVAGGQATAGRFLVAAAAVKAPKDGRVWVNLGALMAQDSPRSADTWSVLLHARELAPTSPAPLANLGYAAFLRGQYGDAKLLFEQALGLAPGLREGLLGLAGVLYCSGDKAGAKQLLDKIRQQRVALSPAGKAREGGDDGVGDEPPPGEPDPELPPIPSPRKSPAEADELFGRKDGPPPVFGEIQGVGSYASFDPPPEAADATDAIRQVRGLQQYIQIASELARQHDEKARPFDKVVHSRAWIAGTSWTQWRYGQVMWADAQYLDRQMKIAQEERIRSQDKALNFEERFDAASRKAGEALARCKSTPCERAVNIAYCKERRDLESERWAARRQVWSTFTASWLKLEQWRYYATTDALYHLKDRAQYQAGIDWVTGRYWGRLAGRASDLLSITTTVPEAIVSSQADWCVESQEVELAPPNGKKPKSSGGPRNWCPDAAQIDVATPLGGVSVGCKEVSITAREGMVNGSIKWDWKRGEVTLYAGVGGKLGGYGAELGAQVTFNGSGPKDIVVKSSAQLGGAAKMDWRISAEEGSSGSVKVGDTSVSTSSDGKGNTSAKAEVDGQRVTTSVDKSGKQETNFEGGKYGVDVKGGTGRGTAVTLVNAFPIPL